MIVMEVFMEREDDTRLIRTYSNKGRFITRDGEIYEEAIDPEELGRTYEETDELIPVEEDENEEEQEELPGEEQPEE